MADPTPKLPPMPEPGAERSAFERWADTHRPSGLSLRSSADGSYDYPLGRILWECWQARAALQPAHAERTGWPPGMLQDDSRDLSRALAEKPDGMKNAREAAQSIEQARELSDEEIVEIRDQHLPSQGERFDCLRFARAILAAARSPQTGKEGA